MSLDEGQLALRRTGIGSSEIGAVVGVSPYSPIEVWRSKVEDYQRPDNPDMERGRFLEPAVAQWYAHRRQCFISEPGTLVHPANPLVIATPDRIATRDDETEDWTVELKTSCNNGDEWGTPGTDAVPMHYLVQVQWELLVTGHALGELAVLKWGRELDVYPIPADRELQATLVQQAQEWWDKHVKTGTPPSPDSSSDYAAFLRDKYRRTLPEVRHAEAIQEEWAAELRSVVETRKEWEAREALLTNCFKAFIGEAEGCRGNGWSVTWKADKNGKRSFRTNL